MGGDEGGGVVETQSCMTRRTEAEDAFDQNAKWKNREVVYGSRKFRSKLMRWAKRVIRVESTRKESALFVRNNIENRSLERPKRNSDGNVKKSQVALVLKMC